MNSHQCKGKQNQPLNNSFSCWNVLSILSSVKKCLGDSQKGLGQIRSRLVTKSIYFQLEIQNVLFSRHLKKSKCCSVSLMC